MRHDREVGKVAAWDGQSGEVARLSLPRGEDHRLTFARADVIEGTPEAGHRCTYTPRRGGHAGAVRAKGEPC